MGQPPHFDPRFIEYALNNLRVRRNAPAAAPVPIADSGEVRSCS
jgi:hypothetical protein